MAHTEAVLVKAIYQCTITDMDTDTVILTVQAQKRLRKRQIIIDLR